MASDTNQSARQLLLVSYWYPPAVGAAAERIGAFAKYLPEHGWQTQVLTAERPGIGGEAEGAVVHRVHDRLAAGSPVFADYDPTAPQRSGLRAHLREFIFPDRFLAWQRAAFKAGKALLHRERFDVILASFPPASAVLLALKLHRESGVPLVLDLRDRWLGPGGYQPRRSKARRAHQQLERDAVAGAAAVITVSDAMADAIAEEQGYDRRRICVISNGYEPVEPAASRSDQPAADRFVIAHVGTVIPRNRPDLFFDSLAAIKGRACLRDVMFKFVGNLSRAYLDSAGLSPVVMTTGMLPRDAARREMHAADALLLLTGAYVGQWGHNAKIFEYIQTGRPVLCLEESPGSNDRQLLEQFIPGRALFAPVDDPDAVASQITDLKRHLHQQPSPVIQLDDAFRTYRRPDLTARLAEHLDRITQCGLRA